MFIFLLVFASCDDDVMKNTSREGLGENIPKDSYGVVIDKYKEEFLGNGLETNYRMKLYLFNHKGDSIINQLITNHDYESIEIGDTLRTNSSRNWWLKNYGKQPKEGIKEMLIYVLLTIVLLVISAIFAVKWDSIVTVFRNTIIGNFIGKVYDNVSLFIERLIDGNFGKKPSFILIFIGVLMVNLIIGLLLYELNSEFPPLISIVTISSIIIGAGIVVMLFNGLSNFSKNMRVLAIGAILLGVVILFFLFILGLKIEYMIKSIFGKFHNNN